MLVAIDVNGNRYISTDSTTIHRDEKGFYLCQECKQPVYFRLPLDKIPHFAHYPGQKECAGAWEPDTEMHSMMKQDVYNYLKKFPWVQKIELEYPITITRKINDETGEKINEKIYLPDIYIETINGHKIAVECQAHRTTRDAILQRALTYANSGIYPLFILEAGEFVGEFIVPRDDLYVSPKFEEKSEGDEAFVQRFYIYDTDNEYSKDRGDRTPLDKYGGSIFSLDVTFAKIPSCAPIGTHIETCTTKTDFSSYKIDFSKIKYHLKDELVVGEIPMVVDMQIPKFNFEKIEKLRQEEELRERLRQQALLDKKKEEELARVEEEIRRKREEESQIKREEEIRKRKQLQLQSLKEKLESINIDEPWALYANYPGASSPILLNPLAWKGGDQVSNMKTMLTFFKKFNVPDKTKMMIYKSVCGSGKCCEKDTLILTSKGIVRIEDIVKGKTLKQKTIEESLTDDILDDSNCQYIGSTVKSLNLKNVRFEDDIISNILDMGDSEIISIITNSGFNIKCTPTHKLIIIDDNCDIIFKEAKDISTGDSIAIALSTEIYGEDIDLSSFYQSDFYRRHRIDARRIVIPNKINEDIAELLGYAVAEAKPIYEDNKTMRIYNDEKIIRDRINTIISNLGITSSEIYDSKREMYDGSEINSVEFCEFIKYLGYIDHSENKEIPWSILQSSKRLQIAFLKALFSGDGYVGNENKPHIEYYSTSKKLAEQLHVMLLNMGIFSSLREKPAICVKEDGERKDCGTSYRVSIFGRSDIIRYINTIGFIQDYKKSRCVDILKTFESISFSYQSRTVKGSYARLKRIYEEFKKLGKSGKIIKTWEEDVYLGGKTWKVTRHKELSAMAALIDRGFKGGNINEWLDGSYSASKRQILKLLKAMKECYYLEDFRCLYNIATSNIEFDDVEKIDKGNGHVYDLTIRDNHSYIGNGFINHNSATLLHVIRGMGRGIIVTPFKALQRQYHDDYFMGNKFVMKKDGTRLKVAVLLGRNNFPCKWLAEQYDYQQMLVAESKKPENAGRYIDLDEFILTTYRYDKSAANRRLPCTRPLKLTRNGKREPRWLTASQCPYWIPTPMSKQTIDQWQGKSMDEQRDLEEQLYDDIAEEGENIPDIKQNAPSVRKSKTRLDAIKERLKCSTIKFYESVGWGQVGVFIRDELDKEGKLCPDVCPYYKQFYSYVDSDIIVMNSAKWQLETRIGRKPLTDVETFDEGDYWLDSQAAELELPRSVIDRIVSPDNKIQKMKAAALSAFDISFKDIKVRSEQQRKATTDKISIIDAKAYQGLFTSITNTLSELLKSLEDDERIEEKIIDINKILRYIDKASLSYREGKREETKIIKVFIPYPDNILRELFDLSSKNIIITSGTMHSSNVLSTLFGINADNYIVEILQGRKENPGKLTIAKPKDGLVRVTYSQWENSPQFREWYNKTLNYILDQLKINIDKRTAKPGEGKVIVLTPAKKYADPIKNRPDVHIDFAKSNADEDDMSVKINTTLGDYVNKTLEDVRKVKEDDINLDGDVLRTNKQIIVSTRMIRGADLRDNKCRAVVMTKWPYPDISAGYNQALRKRFGDTVFGKIMSDKAEREAIQYVSRGLRHDRDWMIFSSPDDMAYNNIFRLFSYDK